MYLDAEDEKILGGEYGETPRKMMEILVALGKVFGADGLIPVSSAQISGASYKTIGRWGLEWLSSLEGRVAIPSVLNPIGMPRDDWRVMKGITPEFAEKQNEVIEAYHRLGVKLECTCTPYYLRNTAFGDHLAWSESSAVCYANSVIGARTNREGGPGALAAAFIGKTPNYGLHLVKNRMPGIAFAVEGWDDGRVLHPDHYGAIGYIAGKLTGTKIPLFKNIRPNRDQLKAMGAAMAATGSVALFHVDSITPESRIREMFRYDSGMETITIGHEEINALYENMDVEAVAVGCPHLSPDEMSMLADLLEGKRVSKPFYVFAARGVINSHPEYADRIRKSGAMLVQDTCMVVSPEMDRYSSIMVDSAKALAYVPNMCGAVARFGTMNECVDEATQ